MPKAQTTLKIDDTVTAALAEAFYPFVEISAQLG
jgi:hypothetical protein